MKCAAALLALALLAGCSHDDGNAVAPVAGGGADLEQAAIRAGVIDDPASRDPAGVYVSDGDRLCVVPAAGSYRVGISVAFDDRQGCSGSGTATRSGATLHVNLAADGCSFDARFEGDRIVLPGELPDSCRALCSGRATLTALALDRQSDSVADARTVRDATGHTLCSG